MKQITAIIFLLFILCSCRNRETVEQHKIIHSSTHFDFYYYDIEDNSFIELSETLEDNYSRIVTDLNVILKEKVKVVVFPSVEEFHKKIGRENLPDWAVGMAGVNKISMVSPSNPGNVKSKQDLYVAAVHEFAHVVVKEINPTNELPNWLQEGIAGFEAKDMNTGRLAEIKAMILEDKIPSLNLLDKGGNDFLKVRGYWFSYTVIDFIVSQYGYEKLISFIKTPMNYKGIFGKSKNEFEEQWTKYIKLRYKD